MSTASPVGPYLAFEGSPQFVIDGPGSATIDYQPATSSASLGFQGALLVGLTAAALSTLGFPEPLALRRIDLQNVRSTSPHRGITTRELGFLPDAPLADSFSRLLSIGNGWADGDGIAPQLPAMAWARDFARALGHHLAEQLIVAPTLEGGVVLERQIGSSRWSLDIDPDGEPFLVVVSDGSTSTVEPVDADVGADSFRAFVAKLSAMPA